MPRLLTILRQSRRTSSSRASVAWTAYGHYLTVTPAAKADSAYRIIFETDGKKVVHYRAGIRPQVEYVEGCS